MKKLIYGVGINDAAYGITGCPFYGRWIHMLERSYSSTYQSKRPTYIGTTVCKEWHSFMNFKRWMEKQEWRNNALDKDVLYPGNKHYSPKYCAFVSTKINNLLIKRVLGKRAYPLGVYKTRSGKRFSATIAIHSRAKHIGIYNSIDEAHQAYLVEKILYIKTFFSHVDNRVTQGLKRHIKILEKGLT